MLSSHPENVVCVIGVVVAGIGMNKDRKPLAISKKPLDHFVKLFFLHGHLAGTDRMRPNRPVPNPSELFGLS